MSQKHLLLAAVIISTAAAAYLYYTLDKSKDYIKSLPEGYRTSDGLPPQKG